MEQNSQNPIQIINYSNSFKGIWDLFIDESKNGTFLLKRDYMDYHSDRFKDYSLLFYHNYRLIAVFPASDHGEEVRSHGGLTYGGLIVNKKMTAQTMLLVMDALVSFCKNNGKNRVIYKRVPYIYYDYPSDEDLYALFRFGATLTRRDISTAIYSPDRIGFNERRRRNVKKALTASLSFRESDDYKQFFVILSEVLSRHGTRPVHSVEEISLLSSLFPENIKLFSAYDGDKMIAGSIVYETKMVAHTQYIAASYEGRNCGALDFIFDKLINEVYKDKKYFDFGVSTESGGYFLNEGLIEQKQEFGGRGVVYDEYTIELALYDNENE